MGPLDQRKRLGRVAEQILAGIALTDEQLVFIAHRFEKISNGADANTVFSLNYGRGQAKKDEEARKHISFIMHWIACAILPEDMEGYGFKLDQAFAEAAKFKHETSPASDAAFDVDYIKKCWYNPKYAHYRNPLRGAFDDDSPYPDT